MTINDPFFADIYNKEVLRNLEAQFGPFQQHHAELSVSSEVMLGAMVKMKKKPRRGEVVMVVPNEQGQIWLHTKAFYPTGTYRLMTGGLESGETPHQALLREVEEETSFKTEIGRCLAVITYTISAKKLAIPFVSYVFITTPTHGSPQPNDPGEAIAHFRAVPAETLATIALHLRSLTGPFADWGAFRAIAHEVTLAAMGT